MDAGHPFLLVRAVPYPEERDAFGRWFTRTHLADVRRIPGFGTVRHGRSHDGGFLGVYTFLDASKIQETLSSPEAAYARGTWETWARSLDELVVEVIAPLVPIRLYHGHN